MRARGIVCFGGGAEGGKEEKVGEVVYVKGVFKAVFFQALTAFRHVACVEDEGSDREYRAGGDAGVDSCG